MGSKPLDAERALRELSKELGLPYEPQDWGIVNTDACRLREFIDHYERGVELGITQRFELGGLILASANDALALGKVEFPDDLALFLERNADEFASHLEYWRGLRDSEVFPLADWLREHLS